MLAGTLYQIQGFGLARYVPMSTVRENNRQNLGIGKGIQLSGENGMGPGGDIRFLTAVMGASSSHDTGSAQYDRLP